MTIDTTTAKLLHNALTSNGDELLSILQEAPPEIVLAALKNRAITESQLVTALRRQDLTPEILRSICRLSVAESSHTVKFAVARHPNTPSQELLKILPHLYLFELLNICLLAGVTPDQKLAAERTIIQRLPMTPLGNKMTLARRATPLLLEELLKEGDPRIIEICLTNPRIKEGALFQFLRSGKATAETISQIARNSRWQSRPNLKEAILTNPRTPLIWFSLWLPGMKNADLKRLIDSNRLTALQKKEIEECLKKR